MLYLIEGLDCSGKKTIASYVKKSLSADGINVEICIGSVGSKIVSLLSHKLVHDYNIVPGSFKDKFRKWLYCMEPIIDYLFYRQSDKVIIKISSHYRFFARAYVEEDKYFCRFYEKHKKQMVKYDGMVLLYADFEDRVKRHRLDYASGKTDKIETKRFFNNNKYFFDEWENKLEEMMNVTPINTSVSAVSEIESIICSNIKLLLGV